MKRPALLLLPALCTLTSCAIPATGVVEAGGPASGITPTTHVYYVANGTLIAVPRQTSAPGDIESALQLLLQGPTDVERRKRITTHLPLPMAAPTPATAAPQRPTSPYTLTATAKDDRISIELSPSTVDLTDLAAAQIICTAVAAQHITDPSAEPTPVSVMGANGRRVEGAGVECPDD
ncbi:hypothetical protein AB0I00_12890 [Streptomyces sp. NPDC050803]|uniref:hypothetical protein n=1 Tax=unclassified Streptomyces TaxID=2593676 RepID=UPI003420A5DC